jgi:hypothetical protein
MSTRAFARTLPDQVNFSPGNAPPNQNNITVMALVKSSDNYGWPISGTKAGASVWAFGRDAGNWFTWNDFGAGVAFNPAGHWCWIGFTRATGNATWHFKDYTAGGAWAHTSSGFNPGAGSGPIDAIQFSGYGGSAAGAHFVGSIAVAFTVNSALADLAVEAACTSNASDAFAVANWMTLWNQTSTATAVTDVTGGGGNQSSITGTSIDSDTPVGYNFSLGPSTTPVGRALTASWAVRGSVGQALSTPWTVRGSVGRSLDARWAQRGSVGCTLDTPWNIRGAVGRTIDLPWALRGQISRTLGTTWTVRAKVTSNLQLLWVVNGAPPSTERLPSVGAASLTEHVTAYPERVTAYL